MINDTAPWVAALLIEKRREMSPAQKLAEVDNLNASLYLLSLGNIRTQHPDNPIDQRRALMERRLGRTLAAQIINLAPHVLEQSVEPKAIDTMLAATTIFERLGIPYCVGGSMASSIFGEDRSTRDVDVLIQLRGRHMQGLFNALEGAFYVQYQDIAEAVSRAPSYRDQPTQRATFNAVYQPTLYKVDVFVSSDRPFEKSQLFRRQRQIVGLNGEQAYTASPEDTILAKLEWFEMSNRQLDRQWSDVRAILEVQRQLDLRYLRTWAAQLGVGALLEKAIAGESPYRPPDSSQRSMF